MAQMAVAIPILRDMGCLWRERDGAFRVTVPGGSCGNWPSAASWIGVHYEGVARLCRSFSVSSGHANGHWADAQGAG